MAEPARVPEVEPMSPVEVFAPRTLSEQVRAVATQRKLLGDLNAVLDEKRQAFERSNRDLTDQIETTKRELRESETVLKTMALERHKDTGELQLAPGVKIRRVVQVAYSDHDAIAWARAHDEAVECLKLDKSKFNSLAKALSLPFVEKATVSQVTLSRDLDSALDGAR